MTQPILIPKWLYERAVAKDGKWAVDQTLKSYNAVVVEDWTDAIDLEAVKEKVSRG